MEPPRLHCRRPTSSQLLTELAQRVDFSAVENKDDSETGPPAKKSVDRWPWEETHSKLKYVCGATFRIKCICGTSIVNIKYSLEQLLKLLFCRQALMEVNVLADLLRMAQDHKHYVMLDPVLQEPRTVKSSYQLYNKKKVSNSIM